MLDKEDIKELTTVELISAITEFNEIHKDLQDEQVDEAMAYVVKLIVRSDIPAAKVPGIIVKLQALSASFAIKNVYYKQWHKTTVRSPEGQRKELYEKLSVALDSLVAALKYLMRN